MHMLLLVLGCARHSQTDQTYTKTPNNAISTQNTKHQKLLSQINLDKLRPVTSILNPQQAHHGTIMAARRNFHGITVSSYNMQETVSHNRCTLATEAPQ